MLYAGGEAGTGSSDGVGRGPGIPDSTGEWKNAVQVGLQAWMTVAGDVQELLGEVKVPRGISGPLLIPKVRCAVRML